MKKVIGYIRVSTDEQASGGHSLPAQRAKLEQYAALYEVELVAIVEDAGASAKTINRPGLTAVLAALDAGEAEGVLVAKLDRLTRSVKDLGTLLEGYFANKFALLSVTDQIDTSTAAGRLVLNVLTSVAQWEREAIGERTSAALQHKIANGEHVGAPALGHRVEGGRLVRNDSETVTLQRIAELRKEGLTFRAIATTLTAEGHQTKRGANWDPKTIQRYVKAMEA